MINFIALRVRLIWIIFLSVLVCSIVLFFGRKKFKKTEKIITISLLLALLFLGGSSTIKSLIKPQIKTIIGTFEAEKRQASSIGPFLWEYCFESENEKIYLEMDAISKAKIVDGNFIEGNTYTVSYEAESNLIVGVSKKNLGGE